ncbi:MAG TPA: recombination mediator RecR [Verrucomicrobiae bacterium]|nr:recombination mediator RecR [Verrucomicrobiae bacterium]
MPAKLPEPVQTMIDTFSRLPGVGPKMAARLTFHLLQKSSFDIGRFITAMEGIQQGLRPCEQCGHISTDPLCAVCSETGRETGQICVVEGSLDVIALEKAGSYHGLYHVLGGVLSPMDGIGPDQLRISLLVHRIETRANAGEQTEIIMATNLSLEGEATASYIAKELQSFVSGGTLKLSRIARGLPMGSDIEYADPTTLARALEGRNTVPYGDSRN